MDLFGVRHGIIQLSASLPAAPDGRRLLQRLQPVPDAVEPGFHARSRAAGRRITCCVSNRSTATSALQEDGLTLLELIARYRPVRSEDGYILLRESPGTGEPQLTPLGPRTFVLGESVPVPPAPAGGMIVARFKIDAGIAGAVREFLYKAPPLALTLPHRRGRNAGAAARARDGAITLPLQPDPR